MAFLNNVIKFGYALVIISMILMIWVSLAFGREQSPVNHFPCYFNPLCTCSKATHDLGIVQCRNVPLLKIPPPLNSSKVYILRLEDNGLKTFQPHFLQTTGLYGLEITHNPLSDIPDGAFLGLERFLWELILRENNLFEVPSHALRHLQKLRLLDLSGNKISTISPDNWHGLHGSLHTLILSDNLIVSLPEKVFGGLPMLDTIDLSGNNLKDIDPNAFRDGLNRLTRVLLKDNQLSAIPYVALSPLKLLRTLDLSFNQITDLHAEKTNSPITLSVDILYLQHNIITVLETESFQYFSVVNNSFFDGNPIHELEENAFRNAKIRHLSLRNCRLTNVSPLAFGGLESSLQYLDLSGNNISDTNFEIFSMFDALGSLFFPDYLLNDLISNEQIGRIEYTLNKIDLEGNENIGVGLRDLKRLKNLRSITLTDLHLPHITPEDFLDYGTDLEELEIISSDVQMVKSFAFMHIHGLRRLDLSENSIDVLENNCFADVAHSLNVLRISHGLSPSLQTMPADVLRPLSKLELLDLSNNQIRSMVDTSFHFLVNLRQLILQDNKIDHVHKGTFQGDIHTFLEEIYLSFNEIKAINQHTFADLSSLKQIYLDDNKVEQLERRAFVNLISLTELNLRGNKISTIATEAFQNLPSLNHLDLAYNSLKSLHFDILDQVGTLSSLVVNASHNMIQIMGKDISNSDIIENIYDLGFGFHSDIKILDLSYNNISNIISFYFQPAAMSLSHLYLSNNKIENVTYDVFGNMPHLQWLDLSNNEIYDIDYDAFRNTKKLQVLLLSKNNIENIAQETFVSLSSLRVIDLSYNSIRFIPDYIFSEEGLEKIDLSNNELTRMPLSSFSPHAAATLCELDLSSNNIMSIAYGDMLGRFKSLQRLDLSNNRLMRLDEGVFAALPHLMDLDLSHNKDLVFENGGISFKGIENSILDLKLNNVSLKTVPELPLPRLRALSISRNELPTVPSELAANLTSLRYLDLSHNDLTVVPLITHSLQNLRYLSLAGNPITSLTNTSLLGIAGTLEELDIREIALNNLETGVLAKMDSLHSLHLSTSKFVKDFNIPRLLENNSGLRHLHIQVGDETNLANEMMGSLPNKILNITFSGRGLKSIADNILQGIQSPVLNIGFYNISATSISHRFFESCGSAHNITLDLKDSVGLQKIGNPNSSDRPGRNGKKFLLDMHISGNDLICDCNIGWVEMWQRKKRQYLCSPIMGSMCHRVYDDFRTTLCANKANQTLIEVLKSEIECGWGKGVSIPAVSFPILMIVTVLIQII